MNTVNLTEKAVFITGAGSGLGEATARAFGLTGARVMCADIDGTKAERVCRVVEGAGGQAAAAVCDVSDRESVDRAVAMSANQLGSVDIAINCAAIDHTISVSAMSVEQWDQVIAVNLRGPFLVTRAVLPLMTRNGYGHIVNIASTAATRAWANASAYHASKWGLVGFGRAMGVEGRELGVRVTTIIPGGMKTHFFDRFESQGIPMPDQSNLQNAGNVADLIVWAVQVPLDSALQEAIITPVTETSWP